MNDAFSGCHPIINFGYLLIVMMITMCFMQPYYLALSFVAAFCYSVYLNGVRGLKFNLFIALPMLILATVFNPLFNHEGMTILAYFSSGNPLTLESIIYGLASSVMFVSVILWFSCYNTIMTSDKFIYLFGRIIPSISLVFSMVLRFVPKFKNQAKVIGNGQKCIGRDPMMGNSKQRLHNGMRIMSILTTWGLENGIETADSMRSRGYGLPGRTAFSIYRFDDRDKAALAWLIFCGAYLISGWMAGGTYFRYYPTVKAAAWTPMTVSFMLVYLALVLTPVILDRKEERQWKSLRSEI